MYCYCWIIWKMKYTPINYWKWIWIEVYYQVYTNFFSVQIIGTMATPNALLQMRAVSQMMDMMDAFDEEEERYRARKRRSTWVKQWLKIRDNPRYRIIALWQICDGNVKLIKKYIFVVFFPQLHATLWGIQGAGSCRIQAQSSHECWTVWRVIGRHRTWNCTRSKL